MKRANTMSTITVELIIKMKTKFTSSNAEKHRWIHLTDVGNFHSSWCFCLVLLPVRLLVFLCLCCAPFCVWLGSAVSVLFFGCCRLPSVSDVASPPPAFFSSSLADVALMARSLLPLPLQLVPCGALAQFLRWYLPLGSGCSCDGLVALLYCWECGCALSSLLHFVSWQQRLLAFFPSDAFVASARSFNMFKSMLQLGLID